jgi:hypothetical protein
MRFTGLSAGRRSRQRVPCRVVEAGHPSEDNEWIKYLFAARTPVLAVPSISAQVCCSSIMASNAEAKILTGVNIMVRLGSKPGAVFNVAGLTQFVTCWE